MQKDDLQPTPMSLILDRRAAAVDDHITIAGHEVIFNAVVIAEDHRSVDIYCSHRGKDRRIILVFQPQALGAAGIWVHNFPYGITIAFNRWGSSDETVIDPPLRFADSDGQRFELRMAHKKIGQINRAAIQIVAIPTNYGGPYTRPLYGSDQPAELRIS